MEDANLVWTQEGVPRHWRCLWLVGEGRDLRDEDGDNYVRCHGLATWWRGDADEVCLGRCDKHPPTATEEPA